MVFLYLFMFVLQDKGNSDCEAWQEETLCYLTGTNNKIFS